MDEHERFRRQVSWRRELLEYLFQKEGIRGAGRALEVGCASGAMLQEWAFLPALHGLDLERRSLREAKVHAEAACLVQGDAHCLPYASASFDIVFCHYFLMWVADPLAALREMRRVTRPGGWVLALAEPDYTSRIEEPPELLLPAQWQAEALQRRGADIAIGPRLGELFAQAGIMLVESSCLAPCPVWEAVEAEAEWQLLLQDVAESVSEAALVVFSQIEKEARAQGRRYSYLPTWFAIGQRPTE